MTLPAHKHGGLSAKLAGVGYNHKALSRVYSQRDRRTDQSSISRVNAAKVIFASEKKNLKATGQLQRRARFGCIAAIEHHHHRT